MNATSKNILLFLSFICISHLCVAQNQQKVDSLLQVLKTAKEDTNKVNSLNALSKEGWQTGDFENAKKYAENALQISGKIRYKKGEANAYSNIGVINKYQSDYSEAMKNHLKALSLWEAERNKLWIGKSYNSIGTIYDEQGYYSDALKNYFKALKIFEEIKDKRSISVALANIGIVYNEQGNDSDALKNYFTALRISEEINDRGGSASTLESIASIYADQENYNEALKNYFASLAIRKELGNKHGIASSLLNIGTVYMEQGDLADSSKDVGISSNKYTEALMHYLDALKIYRENGEQASIALCLINAGSIYVRLKEYSEAKKNLTEALTLSKKIENRHVIRNSYYWLSKIDSANGNYKLAYEHFMLFAIYKDSLFNEDNSKQLTEMQFKYETEKKEKEIVLLTKDKEIQNIEIKKQTLLKNSFIGGLALMLVLFYFIYNNYRTRQKLKLESIRNNIAADLHDDIGSTLNSISIYSEVAKKKDEQQDEALEMIGEASRKIIDAMSDIVWAINPENDSFAKIIFRMKSLAYNLFRAKKIEFTFHSDEILNEKKLSIEERRNFYLIFKEAVNNLVKYSNATRAAITLVIENDFIKLSIKDDGIGFDPLEEIIGNGLKNMKRRADEMKGQFKIESSKENGTQIELILKA